MNKSVAIWVAAALTSAGLGAACSAGSNTGAGGSDTEGTGASGGGSSQSTVTTGSQGGSASSFGNTTGTGMQAGCDAGPDEDKDQDGFSINQNDCNDCDPNVNPNAIEVIVEDDGMGGGGGAMEPADEDCDGEIDNVAGPCDSGIPLNTTDPMDGARTIELCKTATPQSDWGVVSAQWVRANGVPAAVTDQWGVLDAFGTNVPARAGENLFVMSSGKARLPANGGCGSNICSGTGLGVAPPGFPQDNPSCPPSEEINDDVGLDLTIKAPSNATGYQFDFNFYSFEFPEWVCDSFNDQFIALVNPAPMGSINGNISFDTNNNPVSVNIAFFDVCTYDSFYPQFPCNLGPAELAGTGFDVWDDAGATSWLQTTAPIGPGETFNVRFAIWDTGDDAWDSTVLIDNFKWIANGGTVVVGTNPVPE
jgi:hypothetical protein